jgi:hypothetical protein
LFVVVVVVIVLSSIVVLTKNGQFLGAFVKLRKATISFVMSVCLSVRMQQLGSHWQDFDETRHFSFFFFQSSVEEVTLKSDNNNGTLHEDVSILLTISRHILHRIRNVFNKRCRENQSTHFMFSNFFSENRTFYEIMSKSMVETEGPQTTSQHGAYALRVGIARLHARTCMHTPTSLGNQMHARTHARTDQ